jgi:hypothetical protein
MELVLQLEALMFLFGVAGARLLVMCRSLPSDVICWGPLLFASSSRMGQSSPKSPNLAENYSNRLDDCHNSERYLKQWHGIGFNNTTSNLAVSLAAITIALTTPVTASASNARRRSLGER